MSTIKVGGMHCAHCSEAVKKALEKVNAHAIEVDVENGLVHWDGGVDAVEVQRIIEEQGFSIKN